MNTEDWVESGKRRVFFIKIKKKLLLRRIAKS
jgi:hypothetical protein